MVPELKVREVNERLKRGAGDLVILDVREPWELAIASVPGTLNIPMNSIPARLDDLPRDKDIAVLCHHGNRSRRVAELLLYNGFEKVFNIAGGIAAWASDVDPSTPTY